MNTTRIYSYFFFTIRDMFLLQAFESFLGDIEQWPSTILNHPFISEPTPEIIKRVSAFFMEITYPINNANFF